MQISKLPYLSWCMRQYIAANMRHVLQLMSKQSTRETIVVDEGTYSSRSHGEETSDNLAIAVVRLQLVGASKSTSAYGNGRWLRFPFRERLRAGTAEIAHTSPLYWYSEYRN